ncbi:MAG: SDR family oxidoreductase [Victivallales bacterium]|nr:SDR family oxidoreductase [Victivallales bacterium]
MSFKERNIVITGSNRGLGRAAVEAFAAAGANVWACARKPSEAFEADMKALAEKNDVVIEPVYFDLTDVAAVKAGIMLFASEKRTVDVLVNNAGMPYGGLMMTTPIDKLREVFEVNYFSQIRMMQMVGKLMMRQKSGSIVNIASVGGIETTPGYLAYGSSKAALIWATKMIAKELAPFGIRVNAVAPGLTKTDMGGYKSSDELEKTIARTALKRMAEPKEIVNGILYLASDESSFVTGTVLQIDGGRAI